MAARRHKRPPRKDWLLQQRYIDSSPSFLGCVWRLKHNRCESRVARNDVALLLLTYCVAGYRMVEKNTYEEIAVFQ